MTRTRLIFPGILIATMALMAQAPQTNVTTSPLGFLLGPKGDVKKVDYGDPKAPTTDSMYYHEKGPDGIKGTVDDMVDWAPDEFISNPDHEFDWHNLKSWHFPPILQKVQLLGNRKVKPGESVTFECLVEDFTGTQSGCSVTYYGPQGRRSGLTGRAAATTPGGLTFRGAIPIPAGAEPGVYRLVYTETSNATRASKTFYADDFFAGADSKMEIEVLPVPGAAALDVIPPDVQWVRMNMLDQPESAILTQKITDPIPVYAHVTDNKSGVDRVTFKIMGPTAACSAPTSGNPGSASPCRYIDDIALQAIAGLPGVYGAFVSVPRWWQPGEYRIYTISPSDKAGRKKQIVYTTSESLKNARINLTNDPANIDVKPPKLFSVWLDKTTSPLGGPVTVSAIVTDDMSGVGTVAVAFNPIPSYINRVRAVLKPVDSPSGVGDDGNPVLKAGLNARSNIWTGTVQTDETMEPGEWTIGRIVARDNADNYLDLLPDAHPEIALKINYTGGKNLHEFYMNAIKGIATTAPAAPATVAPAPSAGAAPQQLAPGTRPDVKTEKTGEHGNPMIQRAGLPMLIELASPDVKPDPGTGRYKRLDLLPPHPARGYCLNCHEP